MSTHKHIDKICCVVLAFTLILSVLFMCGEALGVKASSRVLGYENRLFATDKVHTIEIIIDDWDAFLSTAESETYSVCSVVIDGEPIKNVGIRGKGNTSLSSVSSMDSDRYSFKIEFDQYDNTQNYHGLDKLSLNNIIQDNTYMKDYLVYQMMNAFGVSAPLCSFAYITVNGEDWGLYLAVEGVEDAFLQRNYGTNYGELYKPDSLSFGGGRGNGMDFDISNFMDEDGSFDFSFGGESGSFDIPFDFESGNMGDISSLIPDMSGSSDGSSSSSKRPSRDDMSGLDMPNMEDFGNMGGMANMFGMGSSDVKLQYIDDNSESYSNIFGSAKTDITEADQDRLIASLRQLSAYENIEEVVDIEQVLRYFVVHNFVVNEDSYTGSMIHNYYLYEEDGKLAMIPWDYNLAFGTFQGSNASSSVNDSIDDVLSDRPMQAWIFSDEAYSSEYYALYEKFLKEVDMQAIIDNAYELIAPYVEKDPTAFCTYEEFEKGVAALKAFCSLRSESVHLQLAGSEETIDTGDLNISDMGTMGGGMGGFGGGNKPFGSQSSDGISRPTTGTRPSMGSSTSYSEMPSESSGENADQGENNGGGQTPMGNSSMPNMGNFDMGSFSQDGSKIPSSSKQSDNIGSANVGLSIPKDAYMLALSVTILAAGILFAIIFKRRK